MREVAGDAAILVNPYDTREIKDGMIAAAFNAELRESKVERGKAVIKKFSPEAYKERVEKLYCQVGGRQYEGTS